MRCRIRNDISRLDTLIDLFICSKCNFMNGNAIVKAYFEDKDYSYACKCIFNYCPNCGTKMDLERCNIDWQQESIYQNLQD